MFVSVWLKMRQCRSSDLRASTVFGIIESAFYLLLFFFFFLLYENFVVFGHAEKGRKIEGRNRKKTKTTQKGQNAILQLVGTMLTCDVCPVSIWRRASKPCFAPLYTTCPITLPPSFAASTISFVYSLPSLTQPCKLPRQPTLLNGRARPRYAS